MIFRISDIEQLTLRSWLVNFAFLYSQHVVVSFIIIFPKKQMLYEVVVQVQNLDDVCWTPTISRRHTLRSLISNQFHISFISAGSYLYVQFCYSKKSHQFMSKHRKPMVKATMVHHVFSHTGHQICIERQGMRLCHDALPARAFDNWLGPEIIRGGET